MRCEMAAISDMKKPHIAGRLSGALIIPEDSCHLTGIHGWRKLSREFKFT